MSMQVIFLGSKKLGFQCFQELLTRADRLDISIVAIGTNSRGEAVKQLAESRGICIIKEASELHKFEYDLLISVQYHAILKPSEIATAKQMAVNLHMAPLPEYRGCNQFSFAIVNGDKEFGTTLHVMDNGIDTGAILAERRFPIPDNIFVGQLLEITEQHSFQMFKEILSELIHGNLQPVPQSSFTDRKTPKLHYRRDIETLKRIDPSWPTEKIDRHIRATIMKDFDPPFLDFGDYRVYLNLAKPGFDSLS